MERMKRYFKKLMELINRQDMKVLPGQLAFFIVLSIFPILALIGLIASSFNISIASLVTFMENSIPKEISTILIPFVTGSGMDFKVGFYMILGFLIASNGAYSIIVTSNQLYNSDSSNYLKRRIKALFLTILLVLLFIFIIVVLAFGDMIVNFLVNLEFLKMFASAITVIYGLLKWPISFILILFIIKIIYVIAPDSKIASKHTTKGALFATLGFIITTFIYSYYVTNFTHYDIFYGGLTNIVVMMMWIYIISYIFVIGILINTSS